MVLVDTSVWVDHLRRSERALVGLLGEGQVACHSLVIGELACGRLGQRQEILTLLDALPKTEPAEDHEVLLLIEKHQLYGQGLGYIDVSLLAACLLSRVPLWTKDRRLEHAARRLGLVPTP